MKLNRVQLRRLIESQIPELSSQAIDVEEIPVTDDDIDNMFNVALNMIQGETINESFMGVDTEKLKKKSLEIAKNVGSKILSKIEEAIKNEDNQKIAAILGIELVRLLPMAGAGYVAANIGGYVLKSLWIIKNIGFAGLLNFSKYAAVSATLGPTFSAGVLLVSLVVFMLMVGQYVARVDKQLHRYKLSDSAKGDIPTFYEHTLNRAQLRSLIESTIFEQQYTPNDNAALKSAEKKRKAAAEDPGDAFVNAKKAGPVNTEKERIKTLTAEVQESINFFERVIYPAMDAADSDGVFKEPIRLSDDLDFKLLVNSSESPGDPREDFMDYDRVYLSALSSPIKTLGDEMFINNKANMGDYPQITLKQWWNNLKALADKHNLRVTLKSDNPF